MKQLKIQKSVVTKGGVIASVQANLGAEFMPVEPVALSFNPSVVLAYADKRTGCKVYYDSGKVFAVKSDFWKPSFHELASTTYAHADNLLGERVATGVWANSPESFFERWYKLAGKVYAPPKPKAPKKISKKCQSCKGFATSGQQCLM